MSNLIEKYANLLVNYCLAVKKGDQVYINASYLAEPLLLEVAKAHSDQPCQKADI